MEECILYPYVLEQIDKYELNDKLDDLQHMKKLKEPFEPHGFNRNNNSDGETSNEHSDMESENSDEDGTDIDVETNGDKTVDEDVESHVEESADENGNEDKEEHCEENVENEGQSNGISLSGNSSNADNEEEDLVNDVSTNGLEIQNSKQFNGNYLKMAWLVDAFRHGNLSPHIANMFNLGSIYLLPLRENIKLDSVHEISYALLKVMGKLLLGDFHKEPVLRVYTRYMAKMKVVRLNCNGLRDDENLTTGKVNEKDVTVRTTVGSTHQIKEKSESDGTRKKSNPPLAGDRSKRKSKSSQNNILSVNDKPLEEITIENIIKISNDSNFSIECSILNIPEYDLAFRRCLLLEYLKLSHLDESLFNGKLFPEDWNLFIISLIYWCNTSEHVNSYHIKSLIISFIYLNIIHTHCGYFESTGGFNRKYSKKLNALKTEIQNEKFERKKSKKNAKKKDTQSKRNEKENQIVNEENLNVHKNVESTEENNVTFKECLENSNSKKTTNNEAIDNVNNKDINILKTNSHSKGILKLVDTNTININQLILLYEQFLQLSHFDEKLRSNHTCFNKDVIHTFCEYQSLFYAMNMFNSILKFPFQELDMSRIYSGTFLYNLYCKIFNKDTCIPVLFEHCADMLDVYNFLVKFVGASTERDVFNVNMKKVRRKKKKEKVREESDEEEREEKSEVEEEEDVLIDSDNIYSLLQNVRI